MQKTLLSTAMGLALATGGDAIAASLEERLMAVENRLTILAQRDPAQDSVIHAQDTEPADLRRAGGGWLERIEIGGLIEIEANRVSAPGVPDTRDLAVATVEIGIRADVNDWVDAEVVALYEDGANNGMPTIDVAQVSIADPGGMWFVNAGQLYLPFGVFDSFMVSDPMTLEIAETRDTAVVFGVGNDNFSVSTFAFQGDHANAVDTFGIALDATLASDGFEFGGHLAYMNNLGESDAIVDGGWFTAGNMAAGWVVATRISSGPIAVIAEYVAASEDFVDAGNQHPAVFNLEAAYRFESLGRPATVAVGYQGSEGASHANWGLPDRRALAAVIVEVMDGMHVGLEFRTDRDYAGADTNTLTGQLAVAF